MNLNNNIHKYNYSDQSHLKRLQVKIQRVALDFIIYITKLVI